MEPTGGFVEDPNVTDKKFPGNPTLSYRSRDPLRIVAEVANWLGHSQEQVNQRKAGLERLKAEGTYVIID